MTGQGLYILWLSVVTGRGLRVAELRVAWAPNYPK